MAPAGLFIDTSMDSQPSNATKLFLGGITKSTTTKQLREHFQRYGRVLDCIAMRQQDGKARGFGYVTLDSPAAASKCLSAPQIIDNRVIDVKLAVPEGSSAASSAAATPMSAFTPASSYGDMWCGSQWQAPYVDDVSPLWACAGPSFDGFQMFADYHHAPQVAATPAPILSTQAPRASSSPTPAPHRMEPLSVRSSLFEQASTSLSERLVENDPTRSVQQGASAEPRSPLGDITNISPLGDTKRGWISAFEEPRTCAAPSLHVYDENGSARPDFCSSPARVELAQGRLAASREEAGIATAPTGLTPFKRPAERLALSAVSTNASTPSSALLATSPLSSAASQLHRTPPLQLLSTTPSPMRSPPSASASGWKTSTSPTPASAEPERAARPVMVSLGTQTDEDEHLCPACGRDEVSRCLPELR